jgi:hypothetical protein
VLSSPHGLRFDKLSVLIYACVPAPTLSTRLPPRYDALLNHTSHVSHSLLRFDHGKGAVYDRYGYAGVVVCLTSDHTKTICIVIGKVVSNDGPGEYCTVVA